MGKYVDWTSGYLDAEERGLFIQSRSIRCCPSWHIAGVGDFLGNGQSDLVLENTITGGRAIWILNNGVLDHGINLGTVPTVYHIGGVADLNGDGKADLVLENSATGSHAIWFLSNGVILPPPVCPPFRLTAAWSITEAAVRGSQLLPLAWALLPRPRFRYRRKDGRLEWWKDEEAPSANCTPRDGLKC